jgi:D-arginine dehydrogenase
MIRAVVIGGGIAGVSAAAHLAPHATVTLVEMEPTLAYHTSGRSAAMSVVNYHSAAVRSLSKASRAFLEDPPVGSVDAPLLSPRDVLWVADEANVEALDRVKNEQAVPLKRDEVTRVMPLMNPAWVAEGLLDSSAKEIDVAGLHQAFVRIARGHDAEIVTSAPVSRIARGHAGWSVRAGERHIDCDVVINASGAWGDLVAGLADIAPLGLRPMRRTAFMVPGSEQYAGLPMVIEAGEAFYFKPDGVQLLCSLAEENPSEPTDPRPRMEDVALAIDRINRATTLGIRTVNSQWTGLRTFTPDRDLAIGEEPTAPGFFWLVGQGGIGIQTSPAYGSLLSSLVLRTGLEDDLAAAGVEQHLLDPARFR